MPTPGPLGSAAPRKYAAISLIGDSLSVVTYHPQVGRLTDTGGRETISLPNAHLDRAALLTHR